MKSLYPQSVSLPFVQVRTALILREKERPILDGRTLRAMTRRLRSQSQSWESAYVCPGNEGQAYEERHSAVGWRRSSAEAATQAESVVAGTAEVDLGAAEVNLGAAKVNPALATNVYPQ